MVFRSYFQYKKLVDKKEHQKHNQITSQRILETVSILGRLLYCYIIIALNSLPSLQVVELHNGSSQHVKSDFDNFVTPRGLCYVFLIDGEHGATTVNSLYFLEKKHTK